MAAGFKTATVRSGDVPATQTNFPSYVDLDRLGITTLAEAQSVRVYADSAKTTEWAREIVSLTEMHVKVPSLTSTVEIFVDWDGVRADYAVGATYGRNNVWSDYVSVHHLQEDPSGTAPQNTDSTGNGYDTTSQGSMTTADLVTSQIEKGIQTDGIDDILLKTSYASVGITSVTAQIWAKPDTTSVGGAFFKIGDSYGESGTNSNGYTLGVGSSNFDTNGNDLVGLFENRRWIITNSEMGTGWSLLHLVLNASSKPTIYKNATSVFSDTGVNPNTPSTYLHIGGYDAGGSYERIPKATVDEMRVRQSILSANWITTEYNNQNAESTFWGAWTDAGGGGGGGAAQTARRGAVMMM